MIQTNNIPNNLRSHRKQAGLSQLDVAKVLGLVSSDRISHWENGSAVPHIVNLFKLSVLYKVPPEILYKELFQSVEHEVLQPISLTK
jgi:transcriptional regulator with XRE-family HTH domain